MRCIVEKWSPAICVWDVLFDFQSIPNVLCATLFLLVWYCGIFVVDAVRSNCVFRCAHFQIHHHIWCMNVFMCFFPIFYAINFFFCFSSVELFIYFSIGSKLNSFLRCMPCRICVSVYHNLQTVYAKVATQTFETLIYLSWHTNKNRYNTHRGIYTIVWFFCLYIMYIFLLHVFHVLYIFTAFKLHLIKWIAFDLISTILFKKLEMTGSLGKKKKTLHLCSLFKLSQGNNSNNHQALLQ